MKVFEKIQLILDKGLGFLTREDQHELSKCLDELYTSKANTKQEIRIIEQTIKSLESERTLELKLEEGEDGKKKYTEIQIKSLIQQEKQEKQIGLYAKELELDIIEGKIKATENYRIDCRDNLNTMIYLTEK